VLLIILGNVCHYQEFATIILLDLMEEMWHTQQLGYPWKKNVAHATTRLSPEKKFNFRRNSSQNKIFSEGK